MLQLFIQPSNIKEKDWETAYDAIVKIADAFPLPLTRLESYNGYSKGRDKVHTDLFVNKGTKEECICFYGDLISFSTGSSLEIYKDWETMKEKGLKGEEKDPTKPVYWYPHEDFRNDGSVLTANGAAVYHRYIETKGALYAYALMAIGIYLENRFPGRAMVTGLEFKAEYVGPITAWLEWLFKMEFDLPLYYDKPRLLAALKKTYEKPWDIVCRLEHCHRKELKRNIEFALASIDKDAVLDFYAQYLSQNSFRTWGFSEVTDAWIAASKDLESTLNLIARSKQKVEALGKEDEVAKYDLTSTLKEMLKGFVLWTPQQREKLAYFHTNQEEIETGERDLWSILRGMTGHRLNICPFSATEEELFEAFMYHDPKRGKEFKQIIDDWLVENADAYDKMVETIKKAGVDEAPPIQEEPTSGLSPELEAKKEAIIKESPAAAQFIIRRALTLNPSYLQKEKIVKDLQVAMEKMYHDEKLHDRFKENLAAPAEENREAIRYMLKKKRMIFTPGHLFEQWVDEEKNPKVLMYLNMLVHLKLYEEDEAFARVLMLRDRGYWGFWRG